MQAVTEWWERFKGADGKRRKAMTFALAWKTKEAGVEVKRAAEAIRDDLGADHALAEDTLVLIACAFIPPALREPLMSKIVTLLPLLMVHDEEGHSAADAVRIMERVATSTYADDTEPAHPFGDLDLAATFERIKQLPLSPSAPKPVAAAAVDTIEDFRLRWAREQQLWGNTVTELAMQPGTPQPPPAADVAREVRRKLEESGEGTLLDTVFLRRLVDRACRPKEESDAG